MSIVIAVDGTAASGKGTLAKKLARHFGLHTCPQASLGEFPDIVRAELGIPQEQIILGGMSLGYADPDAIVNRFQPLRDPLSSFVTYWD